MPQLMWGPCSSITAVVIRMTAPSWAAFSTSGQVMSTMVSWKIEYPPDVAAADFWGGPV